MRGFFCSVYSTALRGGNVSVGRYVAAVGAHIYKVGLVGCGDN